MGPQVSASRHPLEDATIRVSHGWAEYESGRSRRPTGPLNLPDLQGLRLRHEVGWEGCVAAGFSASSCWIEVVSARRLGIAHKIGDFSQGGLALRNRGAALREVDR